MSEVNIAKIFDIVANFNHIAHPLDLSFEEKTHQDPSLLDRIGGIVLLILMTPLIVPPCLYLYWASKKVEQIEDNDRAGAKAMVDEFAQSHPVFAKVEKEETQTSKDGEGIEEVKEAKETEQKEKTEVKKPRKELAESFLAFGPDKSRKEAEKQLDALEQNGHLDDDVRKFLLEQAIASNQVDKVELLAKNMGEDKERKVLPLDIPLQKVTSPSMIKKLASLGYDLNTPLDAGSNTLLHLVQDPAIARALIESGAEFRVNSQGDTPLHTCQNAKVLRVFIQKGQVTLENAQKRNIHGESPVLSLMTKLESLVYYKGEIKEVAERQKRAQLIQELTETVTTLFKHSQELAMNSPEFTENLLAGINRDGYPIAYLLARIGDPKLVEAFWNGHVYTSDKITTPDGIEYRTPLGMGLYRLQALKSQRDEADEQKNEVIVKELDLEIANQREVLKKLFDLDARHSTDSWGPGAMYGSDTTSQCAYHHLVKLGELDLLKYFLVKSAKQGDFSADQRNCVGKTPLIVALGELSVLVKVSRNYPSPKGKLTSDGEQKKKVWDEQIATQRAIVKVFLEHNVDVNLLNNSGLCALDLCAEMGDIELVEQLVKDREEKKEEVKGSLEKNKRLSHEAAQFKPSDPGNRSLHWALHSRNDFLAKLEKDPLNVEHWKAEIEKQEKIAVLLLSTAIERGDPTQLNILIHGINFKEMPFFEKERSPLQLALDKVSEATVTYDAAKGEIERAEEKQRKWLKESGMLVPFKRSEEDYNLLDQLEDRVFHAQVIADSLVDHGVQGNDTYSPIHDAIARGTPHLTRMLLERKDLDINVKNSKGETPLFVLLESLKYAKTYQGIYLKEYANAKNNDQWIEAGIKLEDLRSKMDAKENLVDFILEKENVDLRTKNINGQTLLHLCATAGSDGLLERIFAELGDEIKVDELETFETRSATPLLRALKNLHDLEVIPHIGQVEDSENSDESLIEYHPYEVLCRNLAQRQRNVIDMLIKKGANIETTRALCSPQVAMLLDDIIACSSSSSQESEEPTSSSSSHSQGDSSESSD